MRILAVTEHYRDASENGSEVQCADLIDALRAAHEVDVVARAPRVGEAARRRPRWAVDAALGDDPRALAAFLIANIDVDSYDCVYNAGALLFGCRVVAALRLGHPALPLVNHFQALLGPYAQAEARADAECEAYAAAQNDAARGARVNIFISRAEQLAALQSGMPQDGAATVVPNGLPFDTYAAVRPSREAIPPARRDGFVIVTAGRFADYVKGGDLIYRAFARLAAAVPDAFLLSISNSDRFVSLLREVPDNRWALVRWLPRAAFLAALAGADLVVLPSRHEPFGLIAIEALSFGVPVLANAVGGLAETVRDGVVGRLNPLRDGSFGLYAAMLELSADRTVLAAMGRAGRELVRGEYVLERIARLVEEQLRRASFSAAAVRAG